jgi:hypothetical protein
MIWDSVSFQGWCFFWITSSSGGNESLTSFLARPVLARAPVHGLGGVLSPFREWWEFADITDRQLSFISMSVDIVLCVLICEDLARPDPVARFRPLAANCAGIDERPEDQGRDCGGRRGTWN